MVIFAMIVIPEGGTLAIDPLHGVVNTGISGESTQVHMPNLLVSKDTGFIHRKLLPVGSLIQAEQHRSVSNGSNRATEGGNPEFCPRAAFPVRGPVVGIFDPKRWWFVFHKVAYVGEAAILW